MDAQLIAITDPDRFKAAGLPWVTENQARWAFRRRKENGLAGAFVRIGKRVHINVPAFHQLAARNVA